MGFSSTKFTVKTMPEDFLLPARQALCIDQYVSLLECYIKRYPEQYRNWHGLTQLNSPDAGAISPAR